MTTLREHIESLRAQIDTIETGEKGLIQELGRALAVADEALVEEVKRIAITHEQRRRQLVTELAALAVRIAHLPPPAHADAGHAITPPLDQRYATRDQNGAIQRIMRPSNG